MANDSITTASQKNYRTICLPFCDKEYGKIIDDAEQFRHSLDCIYEEMVSFLNFMVSEYQSKKKLLQI